MMDDEFGNDILTLTDDDGNVLEVEHLDTIEHNGSIYMAFLPAEMSVDDSYDLIVMKVEKTEGSEEEILATLEDEVELSEVFAIFAERLEQSFEDE